MVRCNIKLPLVALLLGIVGCNSASGDTSQCSTGAECPSGACNAGRCVAASGGAAGQGGAAGASTGGTAGAAGAAGSATGGAAGTTTGGSGGGTSCAPNHDGVIERKEVPLAAGLNAKFMVSGATAISSAGDPQTDGSKLWNLAGTLSGDHLALVELQSLSGKWFEPTFPGASYAARLSETSDLLGVFEITANALLLRGVVSPTDGATKTQLSYAPPVTTLDFPLSEGKSWSTTSTITGFAQGLPVNYTEKYENSVDAHGTLSAPFGDFPVLRTRVVLTRTVGLATTVVRSFLFDTECFGTVASMLSQDNEPNTEISQAAEVRRLAP